MVVRKLIVFMGLVGMLCTTGAVLHARTLPQLALGEPEPEPEPDPEQDPQPTVDPVEEPEPAAVADQAEPVGAELPPPTKIHVVALGWELLAPGVLAEDSDVVYTAVTEADEINTRLGRGGEGDGADVALLPYPTFVASYERMRALSPEVFFVVGWSHGRDAVQTARKDVLRQPPKRGLVLAGESGQPATLLGLFALDRAGVALDQVELVEDLRLPDGRYPRKVRGAAARPDLIAIERSLRPASRALDARKLAISTADATALVPIVAVAPAGYIARNRAGLVTWGRTWLESVEEHASDPPAAARRLAAEDGAPEAAELIDALGWIEFATLRDNVQLAGLSGRDAVNLDSLFHRTWELWRAIGVLSTPAPEQTPLDSAVIAEVALSDPEAAREPSRSRSRGRGRPLFVHTSPPGELTPTAEHDLVAEAGFLAGVFSRSELRVVVRKDRRATKRLIQQTSERYGVPARRLAKGRRIRTKHAATIEVLSAK